MTKMPNKEEIKELVDYLDKVADSIPNGLSRLKDAVSFSIFELRVFLKLNTKTSSFEKALAFALTVPKVAKMDDDSLTSWMINDREHINYL